LELQELKELELKVPPERWDLEQQELLGRWEWELQVPWER
jgi:hypothetical protein